MARTNTEKPPRRRSPSRAERQEATRQKLLEAAARLVGAEGYAGASIQKITSSADIANGTFYNYFESRQDLFDHLLPEMGENLLTAIRGAIQDEAGGVAREELGFRAFFDYLSKHPAFYRVLNEAETFAPKAFANHMENMTSGYRRALRHAGHRAELRPFSERELEVVIYILLSARNYLAYRYVLHGEKAGRLPDWVVNAYMKFVIGGVVQPSISRKPSLPDEPAPTPAERYRLKSATDGASHLVMTISDALLDPFGSIEHGAIAGLVERAAIVACVGPEGRARVSGVSVSFVQASHARRLVARGTQSGTTWPAAHAVVTIHEEGDAASVVATGSAVLILDSVAP